MPGCMGWCGWWHGVGWRGAAGRPVGTRPPYFQKGGGGYGPAVAAPSPEFPKFFSFVSLLGPNGSTKGERGRGSVSDLLAAGRWL